MAQIKHIAISAVDNEKLAEFYKSVFGMTEVFRQPAGTAGRQAFYLSDGHINLAILPARDESRQGLNHFGFQIENTDEVAEAAMKAGASQGRQGVPQDGRFAEEYILDPAGARIDLSVAGWATVPLTEEEAKARLQQAEAPTIQTS